MTLVLEAIGSAADNSREEFDIALRRAVRSYAVALNGGSDAWAEVRDAFESFVVFQMNQMLYGCDYSFTVSDSGFVFTFTNPRFVKRSITYEDKGGIEASADDFVTDVRTESVNEIGDVEVSVKTANQNKEEERLCLESVMEIDGKHAIELTGAVHFEQSLEETKTFFKENGFIRGRAPTINLGAYTDNNSRYLYEVGAHLERDIGRMLLSRKSGNRLKIRTGPWIDGIMYATHGPAVKNVEAKAAGRVLEDSDRLLAISAKITGTYREGNWLGITFETIGTQAGKDMAVLLMEGLVPGVSLRAHAKEEVPNERGGFDVKRLQIEGFGVDFTTRPAMPGAEIKGIKLESRPGTKGPEDQGDELKIEDIKTLADLKEHNPALFEEAQVLINSGKDAATALAEAKETAKQAELKLEARDEKLQRARVVLAKNTASAVLTFWEESLKKDKSLSTVSMKSLMESGKAIVDEQALAILESRSELDPETQDFKDSLTSAATPILDARKDDLKAMLAEELKARNITDPPDITKTIQAPDGTAGVFNTIDTLDPRHELIESENEMVGLPRALHGNQPVPAPIKDCILSKAYGIPMYEDQGGVPIPIGATFLFRNVPVGSYVALAHVQTPPDRYALGSVPIEVTTGLYSYWLIVYENHPILSVADPLLDLDVPIMQRRRKVLAVLFKRFPTSAAPRVIRKNDVSPYNQGAFKHMRVASEHNSCTAVNNSVMHQASGTGGWGTDLPQSTGWVAYAQGLVPSVGDCIYLTKKDDHGHKALFAHCGIVVRSSLDPNEFWLTADGGQRAPMSEFKLGSAGWRRYASPPEHSKSWEAAYIVPRGFGFNESGASLLNLHVFARLPPFHGGHTLAGWRDITHPKVNFPKTDYNQDGSEANYRDFKKRALEVAREVEKDLVDCDLMAKWEGSGVDPEEPSS